MRRTKASTTTEVVAVTTTKVRLKLSSSFISALSSPGAVHPDLRRLLRLQRPLSSRPTEQPDCPNPKLNPGAAVAPGAMKKNRRRCKAKATKPQQMPDKPPRQKRTPGGSNSGHRACWSDSDEPQSKFIKYDSGRVVDFKKDRGPKYFEPVLRVCRSVICLVATTDGWRMFCSGTVVDHVDKKTWILTSATLVRKPDTQFEAYRREEIKICDTSSENYDGIEAGDIISKLDGVALYSVAQFTAMFLDKFEVAMDTPNAVTLQVVVHRPTDKTTFVAKLNVRHVASDECNESFLNRWMEQRGMVCN